MKKQNSLKVFIKAYIHEKYPGHFAEIFSHPITKISYNDLPDQLDFYPKGYIEKIIDRVANKVMKQ